MFLAIVLTFFDKEPILMKSFTSITPEKTLILGVLDQLQVTFMYTFIFSVFECYLPLGSLKKTLGPMFCFQNPKITLIMHHTISIAHP